jgi:hypothetical protein
VRIRLHGAHARAATNVLAKDAAEFKPIRTLTVEEMFDQIIVNPN